MVCRFTRWNVHCWLASTVSFFLLRPWNLSRSNLRVWLLHLGGANLRSERYTFRKYLNETRAKTYLTFVKLRKVAYLQPGWHSYDFLTPTFWCYLTGKKKYSSLASSSQMIIRCRPSKWNSTLHCSIQIVRDCSSIKAPHVLILPYSLCRWQRMHINPPYSRRRPHDVRTSFWALESRSERWKGHPQCDFDARRWAFIFKSLTILPIMSRLIFRTKPGEWRQYRLL